MLGRRLALFPERLQVDVNAVAVVVNRQDLLFQTALLEIARAADDRIHGTARLLCRHILFHHRVATPRVDEMIEAHAVDALLLDEIEDLVELHDVVMVDREAKPHALPDRRAVLYAAHGSLVGALLAAELVVHILETVERDADVAHADVLDALRRRAVNERAVRRERRAHALCRRVLGKLEEVGTKERFAARKEQHGHAKVGEIVDEAPRLLRRQLVLILLGVRIHVAMATLEVACLRRIPDDDGSHSFGCTVFHAMRILRIAQRVAEILARKKKLRYTDHEIKILPFIPFVLPAFQSRACRRGSIRASAAHSPRKKAPAC